MCHQHQSTQCWHQGSLGLSSRIGGENQLSAWRNSETLQSLAIISHPSVSLTNWPLTDGPVTSNCVSCRKIRNEKRHMIGWNVKSLYADDLEATNRSSGRTVRKLVHAQWPARQASLSLWFVSSATSKVRWSCPPWFMWQPGRRDFIERWVPEKWLANSLIVSDAALGYANGKLYG